MIRAHHAPAAAGTVLVSGRGQTDGSRGTVQLRPLPPWAGHPLLLAVSLLSLPLPLFFLLAWVLAPAARLAPWPLSLLSWPPLALAWAWVRRGWPNPGWAELGAASLTATLFLWLVGPGVPALAALALTGLALLPGVGVLQRRPAAALVGALWAVGAALAWLAGPGAVLTAGLPAALAVGTGLVFAALGAVQTAAARALARGERELAETRRRVEEGERLFRLLADNSADVIALHDLDGRILYISPSCRSQFGQEPEEVVGANLLDLCHGADAAALRSSLALAGAGRPSRVSCRLLHDQGGYTWYDLQVRPIADPDGGSAYVQSSARDIGERKAIEEQLQYQALHDGLTGLPNRACFSEQVQAALDLPGPGRPTVLFIDIDDFKRINDSLGHGAGDALLRHCAERMAAVMGGRGTLARLGGDEFAVLTTGSGGEAEAAALAEDIERALRAPLRLEGAELVVTASIGLATGLPGAATVEELLRDADVAMYQAKAHGKGHHQVFEPRLHRGAVTRLQTEAELRAALAGGGLRLHYQPIVDLETGGVRGFEALVRWQHPTRGLLPPGEFVPAAEANGLILPLGRWVLEEACRQARRWQGRQGVGEHLLMSINVSARQLLAPGFAEEVEGVLAATGVDPRSLQLEITETALLAENAAVLAMLAGFRRRGIRLAIDDFGLGYASMEYLGRLTVDELKIDRSFVARLGRDAGGTAIVRSLLRLARDLSLTVSGEGIETEEQWAMLRNQHCQHGQGFYFARPMSAEGVEEYLARSAPVEV